MQKTRVVDPDWIRIQCLCGSGFGIRIAGNRKYRKKYIFQYIRPVFVTKRSVVDPYPDPH
jgi:hypothetical protein